MKKLLCVVLLLVCISYSNKLKAQSAVQELTEYVEDYRQNLPMAGGPFGTVTKITLDHKNKRTVCTNMFDERSAPRGTINQLITVINQLNRNRTERLEIIRDMEQADADMLILHANAGYSLQMKMVGTISKKTATIVFSASDIRAALEQLGY